MVAMQTKTKKKIIALLAVIAIELMTYYVSIDFGAAISVASAAVIPILLCLIILELLPSKIFLAIPLSVAAFGFVIFLQLWVIEIQLFEIMKPSEQLSLSSTVNFLDFIHWYAGSFTLFCFWILWGFFKFRRKPAE